MVIEKLKKHANHHVLFYLTILHGVRHMGSQMHKIKPVKC